MAFSHSTNTLIVPPVSMVSTDERNYMYPQNILTIADIVREIWIGLDLAKIASSALSNSQNAEYKETSSNWKRTSYYVLAGADEGMRFRWECHD